MHRTRIKFCGMMRPADAADAARAGADAIGLVFYSAAPRRVSVDQAKQIIAALPPFVTPVGLFVDSPPDEMRDVTKHLNLRHVQLHGDEPPQVVEALPNLSIIKAIRVTKDGLDQTLAAWRAAIDELQLNHLAGLLMETAHTAAPGGTGIENDWATIAAAQKRGAFDGLPPLIAAGGLTPANVGEVVRQLRPWAVDVSSGVESSRGIKSMEKMTAFVAAVHRAARLA
jgi:phosphoribosylanthranilate isomerase